MALDKREKLLESALNLFVENGFHHTPTSRIAKEAGIASGTLFYFFPTKDDLIRTLYVEIKSRLNEHIAKELSEEKELRAILKCYYSATLHWAQVHKTEFRYIEQFNTSPYVQQVASDELEKNTKPVIELLKGGIAQGIIKPIETAMIHTLIIGHTFSVNQYLASKEFSEIETEKVINETFLLLWDMIAQKN